MIVASFLTKDLLIDWREGYSWFKEMLIDHNTANNNGGWQWAASTGTDSQPYFRIFNPMTQGEKYDPNAKFIKKYVPELSDTPSQKVHSWTSLSDKERMAVASEFHNCLLLDIEKKRGLTSFLTKKEFKQDISQVTIKDMTIEEVVF